MANKKYSVNWTLEHDGKSYAQGDSISLSAKAAEPLLESGVISASGSASAETTVAQRKTEKDDIDPSVDD